MEQKFYICEVCGNIIGMIRESGVPVVCCGQKMTRLMPNVTDGAHEKHVPVIKKSGDKVSVAVGSVPHPMTDEHFIEWIFIQTRSGGQRKRLVPGMTPAAEFILEDDEIIAAYAYCNLHGLWKAEA